MGVLVFIVFIVVTVAMARRYTKLDNERIAARIRAEREEEIKREKKRSACSSSGWRMQDYPKAVYSLRSA